MKTERNCGICKELKPASEFHCYRYTTKQGKRSIRLDGRCKPCNSARRKLRPYGDKQRQLRAAWLAKNPDHATKWRAANAEKMRMSRRASEAKRRSLGYSSARTSERAAMSQCFEDYRVGNQYVDVYDGVLIDKPTN